MGGVPYYIANNINGLLFHSENIGELARNLVTLLSSQSLRNRLSQKGYERVTAEFDERAYVRSFRRMLHALKDDSCGSTTGGTIADCVTDILK